MKKHLLIVALIACLLPARAQENGTGESPLQRRIFRSAGVTVSPQMLFLGILDAGIYGSVEYKPFKNSGVRLLGGLDLRNKLFQVRHQSVGLNTNGLKSLYNVNVLLPVGAGYSFQSQKKPKVEGLYLTAAPNLFFFKERVSSEYFTNTVKRKYYQTLFGVTWSTTSITKKGRVVNTQLFVPVFTSSFLEVARNMNVKVGVSF